MCWWPVKGANGGDCVAMRMGKTVNMVATIKKGGGVYIHVNGHAPAGNEGEICRVRIRNGCETRWQTLIGALPGGYAPAGYNISKSEVVAIRMTAPFIELRTGGRKKRSG